MPVQNKQEQNQQFYELLKEILDTQTAIVNKIDAIERKLEAKGSVDRSELWSKL